MKTVTITTTWASKQWEPYAKKCVKSIIEKWPSHYKKILYPDDATQHLNGSNTLNLSLADNKCHREFIKRHSVDIKEHVVQKKWKGWRDIKDAVKFSHCVFNQIDAFDKCETDILVFLDADVYTFDFVPDGWVQDLMCDKDITYIGRKNKFSETGFIAYDLTNPNIEKFFARWQKYYELDQLFDLEYWGDADTFDATRKELVENKLVTDNNINDGRFHGLSGGKHPFINSELGRYMDHLKGGLKFERSSKKDLKYNWGHLYWQ